MFVASLRETFHQQIQKILHHLIKLHSTVKLMDNFKFNMQHYCNEYAFLFTKELDQTVLIYSVKPWRCLLLLCGKYISQK